MAYAHTNSKGQTYYLQGKDVTLRNGRNQKIFFFSRDEKRDTAMEAIPSGYKVDENTRTGLPFLKKG